MKIPGLGRYASVWTGSFLAAFTGMLGPVQCSLAAPNAEADGAAGKPKTSSQDQEETPGKVPQPQDKATEAEPTLSPMQAREVVFTLDTDFQESLDRGVISEGLRQEFANYGNPLSDAATVSAEKRGTRWLLRDAGRLFTIRTENNRLNVYRERRAAQKIERADFNVEPLQGLKVFGYDFFERAPKDFAPVSDTPVPPTYALGPGDGLTVQFWSPIREKMTYTLSVNPEGQIFMPVVGLLTVRGLTFDQGKKLITDSLKHYYKNIEVDVTLSKLRSLHVFVAGEAARPGDYTVSALSTAFNALYVAGGPSPRGSMRNIRLMRQGREVGVIDLYQYLLTGDRGEDFDLQQGDTLFIPIVGPLVAVHGEVKRPALYELKGGERLRDVVELAGGPRSASFLGHVRLDRVEQNLRRTILDVNLSEAADKDGDQNNPLLQDGDAVGLFPVPDRRSGSVQVDGPVERPGTYPLRQGMRVSDVISEALGLRNDVEVYQQRADIIRILPDTRIQILPVDLAAALRKDPAKDLLLKEFDKIVLYERNRVPYHGYVEVQGNVERPGLYQRTVGMKVSDLLFLCGQPGTQTYRERADLTRTLADERQETLAVNLDKVTTGDPLSDLELHDRDVLRVYTLAEAEASWSFRFVKIEGPVQRPGQFPRRENMTLKDLIFAAGGLLPEAASEAEIARPAAGNRTDILTSDLEALMKRRDERQNVVLRDRDRVLIKRRREFVVEPATVSLSGEFRLPGQYALRGQKETLKSLIERAGGLTPEAFPEGAVFTRRASVLVAPDQQSQADTIKQDMEKATRKRFEAFAVANRAPIPPTTPEADKGRSGGEAVVPAPLAGGAAVGARAIGEVIPTQRIAVDLEKILQPDSNLDIDLEEGDTLLIPRRPTTVVTAGAVVNPGPILFAGEKSVHYYVKKNGGYARDAEPSRAVVVRANGLVDPVRKNSRLRLGDILIVPTKPMLYQQKKPWWQSFGEIMSVVSNTATTAYVVTQIRR